MCPHNLDEEKQSEKALKELLLNNVKQIANNEVSTMLGVRLESELEQRQETLESWEAYEQTGETIDHDAMVEWLESWGDDKEKSCPSTK